jgi:hypothetical protein
MCYNIDNESEILAARKELNKMKIYAIIENTSYNKKIIAHTSSKAKAYEYLKTCVRTDERFWVKDKETFKFCYEIEGENFVDTYFNKNKITQYYYSGFDCKSYCVDEITVL